MSLACVEISVLPSGTEFVTPTVAGTIGGAISGRAVLRSTINCRWQTSRRASLQLQRGQEVFGFQEASAIVSIFW